MTQHQSLYPRFDALLQDERKRMVVAALAEGEDPLVLGTLATLLAAAEDGHHPESLSEMDRRLLRIDLRESLLPRLEDADVVTVEGEYVRRGPAFPEALAALDGRPVSEAERGQRSNS